MARRFTVTAQDALTSPSAVLTEMVAEPGATARTTPSFTVATVASEVDQTTVLSDASSGTTVTERWASSPSVSVSDVWERERPETGMSWGQQDVAHRANRPSATA